MGTINSPDDEDCAGHLLHSRQPSGKVDVIIPVFICEKLEAHKGCHPGSPVY